MFRHFKNGLLNSNSVFFLHRKYGILRKNLVSLFLSSVSNAFPLDVQQLRQILSILNWTFYEVFLCYLCNVMCQTGCFSPVTGSRNKTSKADSSIAQALTHFSFIYFRLAGQRLWQRQTEGRNSCQEGSNLWKLTHTANYSLPCLVTSPAAYMWPIRMSLRMGSTPPCSSSAWGETGLLHRMQESAAH